MRVLVAHPSTELYGSDRQLLESVDSLTAAGADVTVVLPGAGELTTRVRHADVRTAGFPVLRKAQLRPHRLLLLLLATPLSVWRLVRLIRAARADVVYVNTVTLPHWVLAARLARRPVLVHVHEAEEMSAPTVRRALYAPLLAAHRVIANSETTARVLTQAWRRLDARLDVIANGVPDPGPRPAEGAISGRLVLVSRLSPRKGIDVALDAVARLRHGGRDVSLTVCGSTFAGYEWFEEQLRERAARPDLAGAVTFAGFVEPVCDALAEAEVALVASLGESFGNAAVEAMLAARATVASDVQGLAEIITDGETGLLVPPGDADALAHALERVLADPELRADLARNGREAAVRRYSTARYRRAIVAAVTRLAGHGEATGPTEAAEPLPASGSPTSGSPTSGSPSGTAATAVLAAVAVVALTTAGCTSATSSGTSSSTGGSTPPSPSPLAASSSAGTSLATGSGVVPAPGSGGIDSTVAAGSVSTRPAVALTQTASFGDGVKLRLVDHTVVTGKATRPGEVAGPALQLTLSLANTTGQGLALDNCVVTVSDSRSAPLSNLAAQSAPFKGRVAAGASATARYVFVLASGRHNPYTISVSHSGQSAVVQFAGDAA